MGVKKKRIIHLVDPTKVGGRGMRCERCGKEITRADAVTANARTFAIISDDHPDLRRCDLSD